MMRIVCACEDLTQDFMLQFIVLVLYRELVGLIAEGIDTNAVNCIKEIGAYLLWMQRHEQTTNQSRSSPQK